VKEKNGMMMLEAGATVLADLGVCAIDEFDKLRDEDRSALHEVMEQQTASVAKGGIIATLNARTSILAAANPDGGKYDSFKNILDNIPFIPIPLLTRFDLIFIVKDEPSPAGDETIARHILDMRAKSSFPLVPPVDFDLLKKYIIYAKKMNPELTEEARSRLAEYYIRMRNSASREEITVTPRWLEGLVRLSISRARLLLHSRVTDDDALHSIALMNRMLETVAVDQKTKKVDMGVLYNRPVSEKGLRDTAVEVFKTLTGESRQPVRDEDFYNEMMKSGKFSREDAEKIFRDMYTHGMIYETKPHYFLRA
jgi:replicative DNA helicase Mcm